MNTFDKFDKPPSKDKFVSLVTGALRQAGEQAELHYDADGFALRSEGDGQRIFWLSNVYNEYCAAGPGQRQALLRNFVRSWLVPEQSVPEHFEDVHPDLLPSVRARGYFEVTLLHLKAEGHNADDRPYRPLADHLAVGLAYDLPGAILQIGQHHLDGWKVSFEHAFLAACDNLRGMTKEPFREAIPGVWMSPYSDNHDASRLVLTDLVRQCQVRGDPVALVPNRDTLLVTGSEDAAGLLAVVATAAEAMKKPRFLSGVAVRLTDGGWEQYLPPANHPAYVRFRLLRAHSLGREYNQQGEALQALHEKTETDLFVASYSLLRKKDSDEVMSYCVWSEDVVSLLPEADVVYFFRMKEGDEDGEILANAPWERVQEVAGDLMQPQGLYPERYLVTGFPSAEQLTALRESPSL
jgi:hypothetical protein